MGILLKNDTYEFREEDNDEYYFPSVIKEKLISWDLESPKTILWMNSSELIRKDNDDDCSIVYALALMPKFDQEVLYEISWDAEGVPGGNHLGQQPGKAQSAFIQDLSSKGEPITDITTSIGESCYFDYKNKKVFYFADNIRQHELKGQWKFRLRILSEDQTLAQSIIEIDWNAKTFGLK